jgi:hypothetical protein
MNTIIVKCDLPRHNENYDFLPDTTFEIDIVTGGFNKDIIDSFNLVKTPYNPSKGDKIYFLPGVNVPRVKFKNVCLEHGIKTVRDVEQANVIFGSKKSLSDITENAWRYKCSIEDFKTFINFHQANIDNHYLDKINTALEYYDQKYIAIDYNLMDWIVNTVSVTETSRYTEKLSIIQEKYNDLYNSIQGQEILDESSVINVLNGEDAAEIDQNMFEHLSEMFQSSDSDNHVLAMEIMANSKYVESLIYLELLFYKYSYHMHNCHTKNHVNFKSLLSYLNKSASNMGTGIDDIAQSLIDKNQFTSDKIDIVLTHLSHVIMNRGDSQYFQVKTITVHSDYAHVLNKNYVYEVIKDYVPTVEETLDEEIPDTLVSTETVSVEEVVDRFGDNLTESEIDLLNVLVKPVDEIQEAESEFAVEDNFEVASEEEVVHLLYGVDNENIEVSLAVEEEEEEEEEDDTDVLGTEPISEVSESQSNNNQIEETNDNDDFQWF